MEEDAVPGHHLDLDPAAAEQIVQPPVAIPVEQRLDFRWRLVPALLERRLADVLRDDDVGRVQLAVADDLDLGDRADLLAHQLEDRATEVPSDSLVGSGALQPWAQEGMIEPLPARGEAVQERIPRSLALRACVSDSRVFRHVLRFLLRVA